MADVLATAGQAFDLTIATEQPGGTATLVGLFGIDGVDVALDGDGETLSLPAAMTESAPGVYSVEVQLGEEGPYFATFEIDGRAYGPIIVRVSASDPPAQGPAVDELWCVAIVAPAGETALTLSMVDRDGASIGTAEDGEDISWPQSLVAVDGRDGCWYFDEVSFDEGGRVTATVTGSRGTVRSIIVVSEPAQTSSGQLGWWQPDGPYAAADWIGIRELRNMTGWSASSVSDRRIRELRRMAVETFIEATNRWFPAWDGTIYGLRGQGSRLYLPMTPLMAQDGAVADPTLTITSGWGDEDELETIDAADLMWRVRGPDAVQPYVECRGRTWDPEQHVKVSGTFGSVGLSGRIPLEVKRAVVGLARWLSLEHGQGPDEARDASTLGRISRESSRERSLDYHELAMSSGITGDQVVDRLIAKLSIRPGPWCHGSRS